MLVNLGTRSKARANGSPRCCSGKGTNVKIILCQFVYGAAREQSVPAGVVPGHHSWVWALISGIHISFIANSSARQVCQITYMYLFWPNYYFKKCQQRVFKVDLVNSCYCIKQEWSVQNLSFIWRPRKFPIFMHTKSRKHYFLYKQMKL